MKFFRNSSGHAPLRVNLEPYFAKPFAELPEEAKDIVKGGLLLNSWDKLSVAERRLIAAQNDYQSDPNLEPATYFELHCFLDELRNWIEKAQNDNKDSVVVALRDVEDRIKAIRKRDNREQVGLEIQKLRNAQIDKPQGSTTERTFLNIIEALLTFVLQPFPGTDDQPVFRSQEELINEIDDKHSNWYGISKRNLQKVFAKAKKNDRDR